MGPRGQEIERRLSSCRYAHPCCASGSILSVQQKAREEAKAQQSSIVLPMYLMHIWTNISSQNHSGKASSTACRGLELQRPLSGVQKRA